jgi:DNA-binding ferritin-like protein (Dps family)
VTKRTTISISEPIYAAAKEVMAERKFGDDFSNFVQSLIREEWERRQKNALWHAVHEEPTPYRTKPPKK